MSTAFLDGRGVVEVAGEQARALLHRLFTSDVSNLRPGEARYSALLTPQGKIVVDFLVHGAASDGGPDRFLLDVPIGQAAELAKRLTMYRLRATVHIADRSAELGVYAHWPAGPGARDPRHARLGTREVAPRGASDHEASEAYEVHRIGLGVPEGGRDYPFGETFPHDANLDRLGGVDFAKGCYVGQEVVSRVEHRGTARKRIVPVRFDGAAPSPGTDVSAGDAAVGTMGTSAGGRGLATVRVDRAGEAASAGVPLRAGGTDLRLELP